MTKNQWLYKNSTKPNQSIKVLETWNITKLSDWNGTSLKN